jgi:hypothetical protein
MKLVTDTLHIWKLIIRILLMLKILISMWLIDEIDKELVFFDKFLTCYLD